MCFVTSTIFGLDTEGITDVAIDEESHIITGKIAHFSDIAVVPEEVSASVGDNELPAGYILTQNYPNPFNLETTIQYGLPEKNHVKIAIYCILGQHIKTLVDEVVSTGNYTVTRDGTDTTGEHVPGGLYIYSIKAESLSQSRKLMLAK